MQQELAQVSRGEMPTVRRIGAGMHAHGDSKRYITANECLSEPELIKLYCDTHPNSACLGGYGYMGCRPIGRKRSEFVKYDFERRLYVRADGTVMQIDETYCGRKIPRRMWHGREYLENQIWNMAGLGHPDMIDGDLIIEAKGGLPSLSKLHTALGQLLMDREHEPGFRYGFLFPAVWKEAEALRNAFVPFEREGILLLPIGRPSSAAEPRNHTTPPSDKIGS